MSFLAWLTLLSLSAPACASAPWGGAVGLSSDNVYRGLSMTAGQPAWFLDIHRELGPNWVAGLSAAAERPPYQHPGAQLTAYLQRNWLLDRNWSLQAGAALHDAPWNRRAGQTRYSEASLSVAWHGRVTLSLALSPDYTGYYAGRLAEAGTATWIEANVDQPLGEHLTAHLGVGRANHADAHLIDYSYASTGVRYSLGPWYLFIDFMHTSRIHPYYGDPLPRRDRWVVSVMRTVP